MIYPQYLNKTNGVTRTFRLPVQAHGLSRFLILSSSWQMRHSTTCRRGSSSETMLSPTAKMAWAMEGGCAMVSQMIYSWWLPQWPHLAQECLGHQYWALDVPSLLQITNKPSSKRILVEMLDQQRVHNLVARPGLASRWKKRTGQLMTLLIRKTYTPCLAQSSSEVHLKSGVCTRIKNLETLFFCLE